MWASQDTVSLMRRWFDEVWNKGRDGAIDEMFHPHGIAHGLTDAAGRQLVGPAGFREFHRRFTSSFSDIHIEVQDALAEGAKGAMRFVFTARHTGEGLGVPATGRAVRATGMTICHVEDGKILHGWNEFDAQGLMRQVGGIGGGQVMA